MFNLLLYFVSQMVVEQIGILAIVNLDVDWVTFALQLLNLRDRIYTYRINIAHVILFGVHCFLVQTGWSITVEFTINYWIETAIMSCSSSWRHPLTFSLWVDDAFEVAKRVMALDQHGAVCCHFVERILNRWLIHLELIQKVFNFYVTSLGAAIFFHVRSNRLSKRTAIHIFLKFELILLKNDQILI